VRIHHSNLICSKKKKKKKKTERQAWTSPACTQGEKKKRVKKGEVENKVYAYVIWKVSASQVHPKSKSRSIPPESR